MEAGQTITGKYRLNRVIGAGGMASVWSATNVFTEREFAIKFMLPELARTPEAARRFLLEAKVSGRINHRNIIEVIDVGQAEDGSLFLVMELLNGVSLDVAMRRQKPPMLVREFVTVMRDVADALAAAHRVGVIHRDLKPTNVFLHQDREGGSVPKVLDFGVSKVLEDGHDALTVVGTILGSPLYMSPEQAMGAEGIDGRTDVFAFGSILFEGLCGERPYNATNLNALIVAIATTPPRSIDEAAPQMPEALRALVRECMVTDKEKRLASFDEIVDRLDALVPDLAGSDLRLPNPLPRADPTPEPAPIVEQPGRRRSSDRPPGGAAGGARLDFGSGSSPPLSIQASTPMLGTKGDAEVPLWGSGRLASRGRGRTGMWAIASLVFVGVLVVAAGFVRRGGAFQTRAFAIQATPGSASALPSNAAPNGAESNDPPVVAVDSLPVAARVKGEGRLTIGATAGSCSVYVDGVARGVTPVVNVALSAGVHRVDCVPPGGKPKTARVAVSTGAAIRYDFSLGE